MTVARLRAAGCVFAEDEARLLVEAARGAEDLESMVVRREAGVPLEQILGWAEFCGLRIEVAPEVFVPRRRTELLVREAATALRPHDVVIDLCCGTGAVGAALAAGEPALEVYAADIDPRAVACATRNLAAQGGQAGQRGRALEGDLFEALPLGLRGRVDLVAANAPYVPSDEIGLMPPEARLHEPMVALDGGADGVDLHRRIAAAAPVWLRSGGRLLIETSRRQAATTRDALRANGFAARVVHDGDLDATVVVATLR